MCLHVKKMPLLKRREEGEDGWMDGRDGGLIATMMAAVESVWVSRWGYLVTCLLGCLARVFVLNCLVPSCCLLASCYSLAKDGVMD